METKTVVEALRLLNEIISDKECQCEACTAFEFDESCEQCEECYWNTDFEFALDDFDNNRKSLKSSTIDLIHGLLLEGVEKAKSDLEWYENELPQAQKELIKAQAEYEKFKNEEGDYASLGPRQKKRKGEDLQYEVYKARRRYEMDLEKNPDDYKAKIVAAKECLEDFENEDW